MIDVTRLPTDFVSPPPNMLEAGDVLEIHELVTRVYLAEDSRDYAAIRNLFTTNAVHRHTLYGRVVGVEAIVDFIASTPQGFDGIRHHAFNIVTAPRPHGRAAAISYVMPVKLFPQAGETGSESELPRILGHGVVNDTLVKVEGRWRIEERSYDQFSIWPGAVDDAEQLSAAARVATGE